jgi:tetratricopeptide (TPR) repeat protein
MRKPRNLELNLRFPDPSHLVVTLDRRSAGPLDFAAHITAKDREEIRWYLETYAAHYTTDVDDAEARRIEGKLPEWGTSLFDASFHDRAAQRLFGKFQDTTDRGRLLTISAEYSAILSLPWELACDPQGNYLFNENPRISIRRRVTEAAGRSAFDRQAKSRLRLLFVTSRPSDAGFMDSRAEAQAVLAAVEQHAPGRIEFEFLRPATFRNLAERLADKSLPTVDVIHFDGHGAFDTEGSFGDRTPNTGYLLFERESGLTQFVSPEFWHKKIGDIEIPLVILSACQSAAISGSEEGDEAGEPMGSVAYGLTALGVPAVLAMTHSLLVETAGQLFGKFYRHLAEGKDIGAALDNARHYLMRNPQKHEVQRGTERVRLAVQDWFLPALYQAGQDVPLLDANARVAPDGLVDVESEGPHSVSAEGNTSLSSELPELQEAGFFGRQRELWDTERWFVAGARRISITGFGGQGKTYLAAEAGRWLRRTGMFERVALVSYAAFQGVDAVGYAVAMLGTVLGESLTDANAATAALMQTPTLVILDNLEDLAPAPLAELLSVAKTWSECCASRLLLTSRMPNFHHADYAFPGNLEHRGLALAGLGQDDALNYFQSLMKLPPKPKVSPPDRDALLKLFEMVSFHPLSIHLLAVQLKTRRVAELGKRLESLLAEGGDDKNQNLRASLQLSLDRLDAESRQWLLRLGIFQGGAFEPELLAITQILETKWHVLREQLQATALIEVKPFVVEGISLPPYLKFHPSLSPLLWSQLTQPQMDALNSAHRQRYFEMLAGLYALDRKNPHRARSIALQELPNLLHATNGALDEVLGELWQAEFVERMSYFLRAFGLNREAAALVERAMRQADSGSLKISTPDARLNRFLNQSQSEQRFLLRSNRGEQLLASGRSREAEAVFRELLERLPDLPGYERCVTLLRLGHALVDQGRPNLAEKSYREALTEADRLEQSDVVKRMRGGIQNSLGEALRLMGRYAEARTAYENSLVDKRAAGDLRGQAVTNGELGRLAQEQGNLLDAAQRLRQALSFFQQLKNEPDMEALILERLGVVLLKDRQWDEAEKHYREAARIADAQGNLVRAADIWNELARVSHIAGKPQAAEAWLRKALAVERECGHLPGLSRTLISLADVLQRQSKRLPEARQLAERALAIKQSLDPNATEIWKSYTILAEIADKQNNPAQAREYRRQARKAWSNFPGSRSVLQQQASLMRDVIITVDQPQQRPQLEVGLAALEQNGNANLLVAAIRRILDGERDAEALCATLGVAESMIVETILLGIKDRVSFLDALLDTDAT